MVLPESANSTEKLDKKLFIYVVADLKQICWSFAVMSVYD